MRELKNVKDVLRDVLSFVKTLGPDADLVMPEVAIFPGGSVRIKIRKMKYAQISAIVDYFDHLRWNVGPWADVVSFQLNVEFRGTSKIDCDDNFFYFLPEDTQLLEFKDISAYGRQYIKLGNFFPIDLFILD